ncbi:HNH endonuclease [Gordonia phage RobinSparkles]|nr:HNH endonuclease [Gordonia phage RobinSparkles]
MGDFEGEIGAKTCSKCGKTKSLTAFNRRKVSKDGYRGQCKACEHEYYRNYNLNQRDISHLSGLKEEKITKKTAKCSKCGETKPISQFPVENRGHKGYRNFCKQCQRKYWQEYSAQFEEIN